MNSADGTLQYSLHSLCDTMTAAADLQVSQNSATFEADKQAVYRHPLFPLLALLLEKCEEATRGDFDSKEVLTDLENEVKTFLEHGRNSGQRLLSEDAEVDNLMLKALQVLRIHLLELEKVQELCRDFCRRYISCLRGKLSSENLLRVDGEGGSMDGDDNGYEGNCGNGNLVSSSSGGLPSSFPAGSRRTESFPSTLEHSVGRRPCPSVLMSSEDEDESLGMGGNGSGKVKRGILPRKATSVLRTWLFQHLVHPYPTEEEKRQLAMQTKLTLLQVNNWFINARRRILQPMLDSAHMTTHPKPDDEYLAAKRLRLQTAGSSSGAGSDGEDDTRSYGDSDH